MYALSVILVEKPFLLFFPPAGIAIFLSSLSLASDIKRINILNKMLVVEK
jgi:hypothetical protein